MAGEVAKNGSEGVVATQLVDPFIAYLERLAGENETNRSFDVAASQLERILSAETEDDIMDSDEGGTLQTRDLIGLEMIVENFDFDKSIHKSADKFNAGLGVYIQFPATATINFPDKGITAGDALLVSSGAPLVIGKLRALAANGYLPRTVRIKGVDGPNGTVVKLARPLLEA